MGCNQSKKKDINQNKERTRNAPAQQGGNAQYQPPSQAQNTPTRPGQGGSQVGSHPGSYTDQRILDQDFYKDVVEKAALTFIDVSGQKDVDTQARDYSAQVKGSEVATTSTMFQVPAGARSNSASLVATSGVTEADQTFMDETLAGITLASQSMVVQEKGQLVVEFPELPSAQ